MKDRPIWRPNTISAEDWDNLSREEQIRWWKDNSPSAKPLHPLTAITQYQDGKITKFEIPIYVLERLTVDNVKVFTDGCPPEFLKLLQAEADKLPADDDDDGWGNVPIFHIATYAPWVSAEDIKKANAERVEPYREGVRLFREHLDSA